MSASGLEPRSDFLTSETCTCLQTCGAPTDVQRHGRPRYEAASVCSHSSIGASTARTCPPDYLHGCAHAHVRSVYMPLGSCYLYPHWWFSDSQFPRTPINCGHQAGQYPCLPHSCPVQTNLTGGLGKLRPGMTFGQTTLSPKVPWSAA